METQISNQSSVSFISRFNITIELISALVTWLIVSGSALYFMWQSERISEQQIILAIILFVSYLCLWLLLVRQTEFKHEKVVRLSLLVFTFINVIALYFVVPYVYTAIFMIIWSAALPYFMRAKTAFLLSPLWSLLLYFVYGYYWGFSGMAVSAMLFWTFNLFALVMVNTAIKEKDSREKVEMINLALISTQQLLAQASEQAERVRIARNIHDLLGHHLTALTINLQVASRQLEKLDVTEDSAINKAAIKGSIEQCHSLSKLLLSDVREAVSDIRNKSSLNLEQAIVAMTNRLPNLNVILDYPDNITIDDVNTAEILTKCIQESITNTLKHGNAKAMHIVFSQTEKELNLTMQSIFSVHPKNTKTTKEKPIAMGNGLKGMLERLKQIKGNATFSLNDTSFNTNIIIPMLAND